MRTTFVLIISSNNAKVHRAGMNFAMLKARALFFIALHQVEIKQVYAVLMYEEILSLS